MSSQTTVSHSESFTVNLYIRKTRYGGSWWRVLSVHVLDWLRFQSFISRAQCSSHWINFRKSSFDILYLCLYVKTHVRYVKADTIAPRFSFLLIIRLKITDTYIYMLHFVLSVFTFHVFIDLLLSIPQFIERMIKLGSQPLRKWNSDLRAGLLLS